MGVAANEVGRGDEGWGRLLTTYAAQALTDVLAGTRLARWGDDDGGGCSPFPRLANGRGQ